MNTIVVDGTRTKFWFDAWCGDCSLEDYFPSLLGLTFSRSSQMADF